MTDESATEGFGCIHHSGTLDKTLIPFDLYVKVSVICSCYYSISALRGRLRYVVGARPTSFGLNGINSVVLWLFTDATSA